MTRSIWRIAVDASAFRADDLSGAGAKRTGGRWNSPGIPMIYCSSSIALAALETLVNLGTASMPFNRFLVRIDIPVALWRKRIVLDPLPGGWDAVPAGTSSRAAGDAWAKAGKSALLLVPSVIVPDEYNVLLNPLHKDRTTITATTLKRWIYDPRFFP